MSLEINENGKNKTTDFKSSSNEEKQKTCTGLSWNDSLQLRSFSEAQGIKFVRKFHALNNIPQNEPAHTSKTWISLQNLELGLNFRTEHIKGEVVINLQAERLFYGAKIV